MTHKNIQAVILAAGKSKRFNTETSKLVERICGKEMVLHTTSLLENMHIPTTVVVGYKKELIINTINSHHGKCNLFDFVHQQEQLGTGHALLCTKDNWHKDHILVMNGDTPLLTEALLQNLIDTHIKTNAALSFIVAHNIDPSVKGYGLVFQEQDYVKIVEEKDLENTPPENLCLNGGIYILKRSFLEKYIPNVLPSKKSGEFYITSLMEIASKHKLKIQLVDAPFDTIRGVNTLRELWVAEQIKRSHIIDYWMQQGVRFSGAQNVHIDEMVKIGRGTFIGSGVHLLGNTEIGEGSCIDPYCIITRAKIGNKCSIKSLSVIKDSSVGNSCKINSFVHIHGHSVIQDHSIIASFTEINAQKVPTSTHAKSLSEDFVGALKTSVDKSFTEGA
jgi:bifunctional UDP-N-acetylglucosamine pyrophosphorylase / glucosamine-1-phosphate N-acetyltransferase